MATGLPASVSVAVEFTGGVWTEVGSRINRLTIARGENQPGTLSFDLENTDGLVTPDYALGSYYPNFVEGKRIRVQARTAALGAGNLLSAENASFEGATVGGWAGNPFGYTASTVANTVTFAQFGTRALLTTWPAAAAFASANQITATGLVVGRDYTFSAYVRVPASNPAVRIGELFGVVTQAAPAGFSRTSTTTGAFERIAVTFNATSDTLRLGIVNATVATAGQTVVIDGVQLDEGTTVGTFTTTAPTYYTRFVGRISQLEPVLGVSQGEDVVSVTATDLLGDLSRMKMRPLVQMLVASELIPSVQAIYPLTDPNGKRGSNDLLGEVQALRVRSFGPLGSIEYNAVGELGPDGQRFVNIKGQKALEHKSSAIFILPSSASGNALTVAVRIPEEGQANLLHLGRVSWTGYEAAQNVEVVYTGAESSGTGVNSVYVLTRDSTGADIDVSADLQVDPGWVIIQLKWVSGSLTMTLSNGNSATISDTNTSAYTRLALGNLTDTLSGTVPEYDGSYGYAIVNTGGAVEEMTNALLGDTDTYPYTITEALALFTSAARLTDLQATVGVSSAPVNSRYFASIPYADRTALDVLLDIATSEAGIVYHDYSTSTTQNIVILSRDQSRSSTVALSLDAEADLAEPPVYSRGVLDTVSQATVSNSERDVTVTDSTMNSVVGAAGADLQTVMDDVYDMLALGHAELARSNTSSLRVSSVVLDLMTAQNDLYASAFAVTEGELIRTTNLPVSRVGAPYLDGYASTHTEEIGVDTYTIAWGLLPADAPPEARFDDTTYGRFAFGDGICTVTGGTAVGTTATGTMTLTWTGSSTLSTSAGDYPMDFDWNGERVTVTTPAGGSTSPRTLTISARGVGNTTARVHAAGEAIDLWNAARFAY